MKYTTRLNPGDTREAYAAELRRFADRGEVPNLYEVADYVENVGLEDEIETLKADLDSEENSVSELEADVADLRNQLDEANDKLDGLKAKAEPKKKRTTTP